MKKKLILLISALLLLATVICLSACAQWEPPYSSLDKSGYKVSIRFDAGEAKVKGKNEITVVEAFDLSTADDAADGKKAIKILDPEDERRGLGLISLDYANHFLAGWYTQRTEIVNEDGTVSYEYANKWDFEKDKVSKDLTLTAKWEPYLSFVEVEGALWIGGCDLLDTAVVDIPREYNGRSVVGILPFAFADRKKIEEVYIPSTMTEIREGAFFGCTALKKIYCEAEIKPSGWSDSIENSGAEFIFGYKK